MKLYSILSQEDLRSIHYSSLQVLTNTGIFIDDREATELLLDHGGIEKGGRICLSADLIDNCLEKCPQQIKLKGRSGEITLGDGSLHVHNMGGARDVYDVRRNSLRPATTQDVADSTRLLDALEYVDSITPLYTPRDVPSHMMVVTMFDQVLRNTSKPINGPGVRSSREVGWLCEMMQIVFGDQPAVSLGASPVSPLNFRGEIAQVMMEIARRRIPFGPLPCPSVGATSPMSLAGSLVLQNAENLTAIVLAQLVSPGLPIVYCGRISVLNMRSGAPMWGNPEVGLMSAATVQIGHFYHLPVNVYGAATSAYAADQQSGYERMLNILLPALAGADELSGVGEMAGGIYSSNEQMIIDNEIYGTVKRVKKGFQTTPDALAVEVIDHAMGTSHDFLREPHTRRYLRAGELWFGKLAVEQSSWDLWRDAGSPTVVGRAGMVVEQVLCNHKPPELSKEKVTALDDLMNTLRNQFT